MKCSKRPWRKIMLVASAIVLGLFSYLPSEGEASELPGKGVTVSPLMGPDMESRFQAEVVVIGLERLGYSVQPLGMVTPAIYFTSVANGDGSFVPQAWWPMHQTFFDNAGGSAKLTNVGTLIHGALQGYLIDKKTADEFGITNLGQLNDPKLAKLFDFDGDGKADLAGCPPGWGCEKIIDHHISAYGLTDTVTHVKGDFNVIHADVVTRYRAGERVLYYTYTPFWLNQELIPGKDVVWLEVPSTTFPEGMGSPTANTKLPDGRNIGFEVQDIVITANNEFLAANPAAKRFFELVTIPIEDVNAQNLLMKNGESSVEDVRRHAEAWVKSHEAEFDGWIQEAAKAAQ